LKSFDSARAFRAWLTTNHRTAKELLVRCYKVAAKDKGLTYREALDEALCFGKFCEPTNAPGNFFRAQAPWYQRTSIFGVRDGKREETRLRRLQELIERSARGEAIRSLAGKPLRTAGSP
jgi:uncharacterized protein YdeI (YjbR/CyaY-like superfamily)